MSKLPRGGIHAWTNDYIEASAEKFPALAKRPRPCDLNDVVNLYHDGELRPQANRFMEVLRAKCEFKAMSIPRIADIGVHRAGLDAAGTLC